MSIVHGHLTQLFCQQLTRSERGLTHISAHQQACPRLWGHPRFPLGNRLSCIEHLADTWSPVLLWELARHLGQDGVRSPIPPGPVSDSGMGTWSKQNVEISMLHFKKKFFFAGMAMCPPKNRCYQAPLLLRETTRCKRKPAGMLSHQRGWSQPAQTLLLPAWNADAVPKAGAAMLQP